MRAGTARDGGLRERREAAVLAGRLEYDRASGAALEGKI